MKRNQRGRLILKIYPQKRTESNLVHSEEDDIVHCDSCCCMYHNESCSSFIIQCFFSDGCSSVAPVAHCHNIHM